MSLHANTRLLPSAASISPLTSSSEAILPQFLRSKKETMRELIPLPPEQLQIVPSASIAASQNAAPNWKAHVEKALIGIEVLAAIGFLFLVAKFGMDTKNINEEAATFQEYAMAAVVANTPPLPASTSAPAPSLPSVSLSSRLLTIETNNPPGNEAVALPAANVISHNWTDDVDLESEAPTIDASLPMPFIAAQKANAGSARRIQIPALNIDKPILDGDSWENLQLGVGRYASSALPGQNGNMVLSAHNDIYGQIFRDLDRLKPGDEVRIATAEKWYTYTVREVRYVDPSATWVMSPTENASATLISCYPYLINNKRIVVFADLLQGNNAPEIG